MVAIIFVILFHFHFRINKERDLLLKLTNIRDLSWHNPTTPVWLQGAWSNTDWL